MYISFINSLYLQIVGLRGKYSIGQDSSLYGKKIVHNFCELSTYIFKRQTFFPEIIIFLSKSNVSFWITLWSVLNQYFLMLTKGKKLVCCFVFIRGMFQTFPLQRLYFHHLREKLHFILLHEEIIRCITIWFSLLQVRTVRFRLGSHEALCFWLQYYLTTKSFLSEWGEPKYVKQKIQKLSQY